MVLEYQLIYTIVTLMWYRQVVKRHDSDIPIDVLLVFVEVHFGISSYLFKHQSYHFLFLWWKKNVTTPALEILVASEVETEGSHELVILLWVHPLLEVGESSGKNHRLFIPIVCICFVFAASDGID